MTTLQKTFVTVTVAALAGAGIYEARQAAQFSDQVQTLQQEQAPLAEQIQQLQSDRAALGNRLSDLADELARRDTNSTELLRLRGEVTRLRNENGTLAQSVKEAQAFEIDVMQKASNTPPVRTFVSTAVVSLAWDQVLVTGGWKTPSGKRVVTLVAVKPGDDARQLTISSKLLEYDEDAAGKLGLSQFNTDEHQPDGLVARAKTQTITAEQLETMLQKARDLEGIDILAAPAVSTLSGRQAQVQTVDIHTMPSGEKYSTGPVLDFIPTIASDGKSVHLVLSAQLNYPVRTRRR